MSEAKNPRQWLKTRKTATAEDLSNDIWVRIERTNRSLEKYGRGDFLANMPVLFAMYYYGLVLLMQVPEEPTGMDLQRLYRDNVKALEDECLIDEEEGRAMVDGFHDACQKMADGCVRAKAAQGKDFNPFGAIVTEAAALLGLPYSDIRLELANHLAEFAMTYKTGSPEKRPGIKN